MPILDAEQKELLRLVADGYDHGQIAAARGIARRQVTKEMFILRCALGANTPAQAVWKAVCLGELDVPAVQS
jgi:DNA-binding NarL/FixJ family response regulator